MPLDASDAELKQREPTVTGFSEDELREIAEALVQVPGVDAVMLGGSRARGGHGPASDTDLGLYYRSTLDLAALGALARSLAGDEATVSELGAWGPWVNGGAWLTIAGAEVDWIYRDIDRVHDSWRSAREGSFHWHTQIGHPLGVPDFAYIGEAALGKTIVDSTGEVEALHHEAQTFPVALATSLVAGLWEAEFLVANARKGASRGDAAYVAGCLFRVVGLCAHAIHGRAGRWLVNEKGAVASAGRLPIAPAQFEKRANALFSTAASDAAALASRLDLAAQLVADTQAAVQR